MWQVRRLWIALAVLAVGGAGEALWGKPAAPATGSQPASRPAGASPLLQISKEQARELTAFLKEYLPESHERIQRLTKENPRQASRHLYRIYRLWWRVRQYPPDVCGAAVACYRLDREVYRTVRETRHTDGAAEKRELTAKLRELLGRHFDQDQVVKEYRVRSLAKQLAELKAKVEERRKTRPALIEEQLAGLLKPPQASSPVATRPARPRSLRYRSDVSAEQDAALGEFLRKHAPELLKQLDRVRAQDAERAQRLRRRLYGMWRRVRRYPPEVREAVIARQRLNVTVERSVQKIRATENPAERQKLVRDLRKVLDQQFGHHQLFLEYRLTFLSRQLGELRAELALRRRNRTKIIGDWMAKLLAPPLASQPAHAPEAAKAP